MAGVPLPELKNVVERQERLTRMKRIATGLFVFVTLVLCRIVLGSERAESAARRVLRPFVRAEANLPAGRFGYDLVVRAEKTTPDPWRGGTSAD